MQESVIYQDILQKGEQRGLQLGLERGKQEEALALVIRQLTRRIGDLDPHIEEQIRGLSTPELEDLAEALLDFSSQTDLTSYLAAQQP